eukprot:9001161-Heterocapsa_arctica.AAC.1
MCCGTRRPDHDRWPSQPESEAYSFAGDEVMAGARCSDRGGECAPARRKVRLGCALPEESGTI